MQALDGKVALVTGAGTGTGRAIAQLLPRRGKGGDCIAPRAPLRETASCSPDHITYVRIDLTKQADRHLAVQTVIDRHDRLDALVNNAADQLLKPFLDQTREQIGAVIDTNLTSTARDSSSAAATAKDRR